MVGAILTSVACATGCASVDSGDKSACELYATALGSYADSLEAVFAQLDADMDQSTRRQLAEPAVYADSERARIAGIAMDRANNADIILSLERLRVDRLGTKSDMDTMAFALAEKNLTTACEEVGVSFPDTPAAPETARPRD